jgi:hypothetical protein
MWIILGHWDSSNPRKDQVRPWSKGMMEASHAFEPGFIESRRAHVFFFHFSDEFVSKLSSTFSKVLSLRYLFEKNRFPGDPQKHSGNSGDSGRFGPLHGASYIFTTWVMMFHWDSSNLRKDRVRPWSNGYDRSLPCFGSEFDSRRAHVFSSALLMLFLHTTRVGFREVWAGST